MMNRLGAFTIAFAVLLSVGPDGHAAEGVFVPRNGGVEGQLGVSHFYLDTTSGGVLEVVRGQWPNLIPVGRVEPRFALRVPPAAVPLDVRQGHDRDPWVVYLEEGHERMGVRVRFKLFDAANGYHGHGMTEIWAYPNGDIFVACGSSFEGMAPAYADDGVELKVQKTTGAMLVEVPENPAERTTVTSAALCIDVPDNGKTPMVGGGGAIPSDAPSITRPFDDENLPARYVLVNPHTPDALGLYWRTGHNDSRCYIFRGMGDSPTYFQWPGFLIQAYGGHRVRRLETTRDGVRMDWMEEGTPLGPNPEFTALFRLAAGTDAHELAARADSEREPADLAVAGGVHHALRNTLNGYNDLEGLYEVLKTNDPVRVTIPAGPPGRPFRLKVVGLSGHGAVQATLDGKPLLPQLSAEGGIADDPLAPIREAPEGPADMAVVNIPQTAAPQTFELRETRGVQLVYQRKDPARNVDCFTSYGGDRYAAFQFSLGDGVLRRMRAYGRRDWALTENLMHWFSYCGFTPEQMINEMQDFQILDNGPDEAAFRYVGRNATQGAESEFVVRVPDSPAAMMIDVNARFTVLDNWPYSNVQFFDVFPFRGVWPRDWWYDEVLWVAPDGRVKWLGTLDRKFGGDTDLVTETGPMFLAMHSSDRGNMIMLTGGFEPALPVSHVICGNYVDFHMTVKFPGRDGKNAAPRPGETVRMHYQLALWGDAKTTRDELIELGRKSLEQGRLAID